MRRYLPPSFGWRQDPPDFRDYTLKSSSVAQRLRDLPARRGRGNKRAPSRIDLREYFSETYQQGSLGASSAHACVALVEYFERRSHGRELRGSRLFVHQNALRMAMLPPTCEAVNLRAVIKAIAGCGLPPERFWPYDAGCLESQPDAFLYSFANRFHNLEYVRLDARNMTGSATLKAVRSFLAAGFPAVCGLAVPTSVSSDAEIPYRPTFDSIVGGQALVAVGYDDQWLSSSRGALLVRNSWGFEWGNEGYGWLPYAFVEERLAVDFWTVLQPAWLATGEFIQPDVS